MELAKEETVQATTRQSSHQFSRWRLTCMGHGKAGENCSGDNRHHENSGSPVKQMEAQGAVAVQLWNFEVYCS